MNKTPDLNKATSLFANGEDIFSSTKKSNGSPRFMVLNYYCAALEYIQSIIAAEGIQILGKDHHKEAICSIASFIPLTAYDFSLLDNLRRIRNDIQYYGTKSENDINDFYEHNKNAIPLAIEELRREAAKRIGK